MRSEATSPKQYIAELPDERRPAMSQLRDVINANLPAGFKEEMGYGMLGWVVPHELYPPGYHCDPSKGLPFMGIASQKNYISFYHMGLYHGMMLEWFLAEWPKVTDKKLDMGKCCVRFKKPTDIPFELIGRLAGKLTPEKWIAAYESAIKEHRKRKA